MLYVIGGVDCHFWFDDDGDLCLAGPEEGRAIGQALLDRYGPLMKTKKVADCVSGLEPVGPKWLSLKKCAVLSLMLDAEARGDRAEDVVLTKALTESRITEDPRIAPAVWSPHLTGSAIPRLITKNLGVVMSVKKQVLLSVESKQGVELYTGDLVVGPQNGFAVVPGTMKPLALKAIPITPDMLKQSKRRSNARRFRRKSH